MQKKEAPVSGRRGREMGRKGISALVLMLILTISLGTQLVVASSFTDNGGGKVATEDHIEKSNKITVPNKTLKSAYPSSQDDANDWNLNGIHEKGGFDHRGANETKLIFGINSDNPRSLIELEKVIARHGAKIAETISIGGKVEALVIEPAPASANALVEDVRTNKLASYVEPDMKVQTQFIPDDPYWSSQWGPQKIEADWAWNTTIGSSSILVAVVDTGIDYTHPDLAANYATLGYDWVNNDSDPIDDFGHGTHVAGIIAAVANNSVGIAGLAQVRVMAEKALDSRGEGYWSWIADAIVHAVDQGARIISMSFGAYSDSRLIHEAIQYAYDAGVLLIAAAGNANVSSKSYPAGYDEVIALAATDMNDNKAVFSNWGPWIDLAAPGVDIYSTTPTYGVTMNDYGISMYYDNMSGTSMACPQVSGVAALLWSLYPTRSRDWISLWLEYTADDLGDPGFDMYYGHGRINARRAVEQSLPAHDLIAYSLTSQPYLEPRSSGILNATIVNFGESNETDVTVQLMANGTTVDSVTLDFLNAGDSTTISLVWNPSVEGLYNVTVYVMPALGETNLDNNVVWKYVYSGFPVKAVVLHSGGNIFGDTIDNWEVLSNEWYQFGSTAIYIDYVSLNKEDISYEEIAATGADVLIISCAYSSGMGWQFTDSEIEAITQYVHEGHGLVVTAGTFYNEVPNNNKLAPLLGLSEKTTWVYDDTSSLQLIDPTHPIFNQIPNPFAFPQVGTAAPSDGRWDSNELAGGTYLALANYRESAIVAYRGLVYISPWLEVIQPYTCPGHLQILYNAITWSRYQKPQHDLIVSLEAPRALKPSQSALLNVTVSNIGLSNETGVEVRLFVNSTVIDSTIIPELQVGEQYAFGQLWTPVNEGFYNITAYALPVVGENDTANNIKSLKALVSAFSFAICQDHNPWSYSSNQQVLERYSIPYVILGSGDFGKVDLRAFAKVIIASHQNQHFYDRIDVNRGWLEDYVSDGGILEIHAADMGSSSGQWIGSLPGGLQWLRFCGEFVTIVDPMHPLINTPNTISDIELDTWEYSVGGLFSEYPVNTDTIIEEDSTRKPVCVEFGYGAGFVIASGQTLEWAYGAQYSLILENILLYTPVRYQHDIAVTLDVPTLLESGQPVLFNATVRNRGLNNETNVALELMINDTLVYSGLIPELTEASFTLSYPWVPTNGTYNVTAYLPPVPAETFTANNIATRNVTVRPVKHVLFDQTHGNQGIIHYRTWVTGLADRGYMIEAHAFGTITSSVLEKYDVLVIPQPGSAFDADELSAIQNFANNGGGLFVMGYLQTGILSSLTSFAGIDWTSRYFSEGIVNATDITPHAVTRGVATVSLHPWYAVINVTGTAQDLVRSPSLEITLAVSEPQNGRIVGFTSSLIIGEDDNLLLANNIIDWLSRSEHDLFDTLATNITMSKTLIGQRYSATFNVTVENQGIYTEDFNVTAYANGTAIETVNVTVASVTSATVTFRWNTTGFAKGNYTVSAYVWPVPSETNMTGNDITFNGIVLVTIAGDVTGRDGLTDGRVDMRDIGYICTHFAPYVGNPEMEIEEYRNCDINGDGVVNMRDIGIATNNFMKT